MMARRHDWSDEDVKTFAQLTADEGRARSAVDAGRLELKAAEDHWQTSQTTYMDAVRQRYHEEQVWNDKWRVLGTYWTWTLIGLNSVVFIAGQVLHFRRETERLNALHDMIRPLTEFKHPDHLTVAASKDTTTVTPTSTDSATEVEDEESSTKTAGSQHEVWKAHLQNWAQSSVQLWQQTLRLLYVQWAATAASCSEFTHRRVLEPSRQIASEISVMATNLDPENSFHWPSALVGATVAGTGLLCLALIRSTKQ
jgi:hypothetical protein